MKNLLGLLIMVSALTMVLPVAPTFAAEYTDYYTRDTIDPRDPRDTRERRTAYTIDYAIRTLDSLNRSGNIYSKGVYNALSKQLRHAKNLVTRDNRRSARRVLDASVSTIQAQSGNKISTRGANALTTIITRIRL